ncbi:MAG: zinc-ribbon domain-containing protein [Paludibacteraceae bacterium]
MICKKCHAVNDDAAQFCESCGAPLQPTPAKDKLKIVLLLSALFCMFLSVLDDVLSFPLFCSYIAFLRWMICMLGIIVIVSWILFFIYKRYKRQLEVSLPISVSLLFGLSLFGRYFLINNYAFYVMMLCIIT